MEQQLTARLGEGEITQFVQDNEVEAGEVVSNASLSAGSTFGLELIDEIDGGEEAPPAILIGCSFARWRWPDASCPCRFRRPRRVALLGDEGAACEIAHQRLVDRRVLEREVIDVLGQRQLGDGELVFD